MSLLDAQSPTTQPRSYTLSQLCDSVTRCLQHHFAASYWITAEVMGLREHRKSASYYMELIEKGPNDNAAPIAKVSAFMRTFELSAQLRRFTQVTGSSFCDGLKVLVRVQVEYHRLYGFSLKIVDLFPEYTLGDLAQSRRQSIEKLQREGIFHRNQQLLLPTPVARLAIISSETAAGWGDFFNHLQHNRWGYAFHIRLFPAVMQGSKTEASVAAALEQIELLRNQFDVVIIIRGGGATSDLQAFDSYELARRIALFPLPVFTGIGHERDECLLDFVAHTRLKTPTAVADYLLELRHMHIDALQQAQQRFLQAVLVRRQALQHKLQQQALRLPLVLRKFISHERQFLQHASNRLLRMPSLLLHNYRSRVEAASLRLTHTSKSNMVAFRNALQQHRLRLPQVVDKQSSFYRQRLQHYITLYRLLSPQKTLERGFSIVRVNASSIRTSEQVKKGDALHILLAEGTLNARVEGIDEPPTP